jgi:single-strand DNA-binding protein
MRGIETAFWGTLGRDPELKTSRAGKPYCAMNLAVTTGTTEDARDITTWVRATAFGQTAEKIATAKKGDRVYVEGTLTLTEWQAQDGQARHGLNVAAWKAEKVAAIGKNREKRERDRPEGVPVESIGNRNGYHSPLEDEIPF